MACLRLGSKSESFRLEGNTWLCSTGLPSDVIIEVADMSFHLHKFPLLSRSGALADLIGEASLKDDQSCEIQLHDVPGGPKTFLLAAKFCYGVKIELNTHNVVAIRCAAEYLQMTDEYGEENLVSQTERFLDEIFSSWADSIKALETCEEVILLAEELHIVSRCITSLAMKASTDPSLFSWPVSGGASDVKSPVGAVVWNGIRTAGKSHAVTEDWWYEDVSFLRLSLYKRLILAVGERGVSPERIAGSIMHYTKKHLPLMGRQSGFENGNSSMPGPTLSESEQTVLLEEIVELLPDRNMVTPTKFLLRLLRTSMILQVGQSCQDKLERRIGSQLDQALLEDILIPNVYYSAETLYDIDCVQRILDHFMTAYQDGINPVSGCLEVEGQELGGGSHSLTPMTMVASLIDGYLAEVATDVNLKLQKFQALAAAIPDYARPLDDGIYRAVDIYLKAHPWLTDSEREQICRLMNCQKLSMEACTHAAQNERLPLRVIVQVLFFEQLRLRTSIAGWFFVSDNLEGQNQNPSRNSLALTRTGISCQGNNNINPLQNVQGLAFDDMKERVSELEKECLSMKQDLRKLVKTKGSWNVFFRRFGLRLKHKKMEARPAEPSR
ncbi:BTB/POZ domain-containing protein At5g03250-like [Punica granatum]|uniref:Uncharacterized protein n=2 Tax=Punica granatum TaxID=22663 RepID=A0A218XSG2_PUNGR|nr:BTB/POZ domain-containing protein At5g03250-like [Punica granatum]OWM87596.1 hypothetical protein CDL15_Pgr022708 [Punica granatum]PKI74591.1 hypothetical protein CRG98_004918 [Punica granatum]